MNDYITSQKLITVYQFSYFFLIFLIVHFQ